MLVRSIDHIKPYLPVNTSLEFEKLIAFRDEAERQISEKISEDFYTELDAYIDDPDPVDTYAQKLIELLRDSITYMSFDIGFDVLNTVFSNQGFHRIENEQSGKKALFQRQEENLRKTFRRQGWNKLDVALAYMEKNKTEFPTWVASDEYLLTKNHIINSTKDFNGIYNINNNRLVFMRLLNAQGLVEDFDIKPLLGIDYYNEIMAEIAADTVSADNVVIVNMLMKAVAHRSIYRGGLEMLFELNEYGFYEKQVESIEVNFKTETLARESLFKQLIEQAEQNGYAYMLSVESYLKANIEDYPTYAASTAYNSEGSSYAPVGTDKIVII